MSRSSALLSAAAILLIASMARGQEAVAVIGEGPSPYQDAFESFKKAFARPVHSFQLPYQRPAIGPEVRVVVAFGGEAALEDYPKRVVLIVGLAPSLPARSPHGGPFAFVAMKPSVDSLLTRMRSLQPGLKRLGVFWNDQETGAYTEELRKTAARMDVEVVSVHVPRFRDLPIALRAQTGKIDALWLAPDANLVTPEAFQTLKQFSWDNSVPFYAPTACLAEAGAAVAVAVSPEEVGRQAADLARKALAGEALSQAVYPEKNELVVNRASSIKAGLAISSQVLSQADKVIE